MAKKAMKYGLMSIVAVLLMVMAFVGAASATDINSLEEYKTNFVNCATVSDGTYYIKGNWGIPSSHNGNSDALTISGDVVLDFTNFTGGITNLPTSGKYIGGIFGFVTPAGHSLEIRGLNLTSVNIVSSGESIGGIIGFVNGSGTLKISNCNLVNCSIGSISSGKSIGGMIGRAYSASVNFEYCDVLYCDILTSSYGVGGLVGCAGSASFLRCHVKNSTVASQSNSCVGGLAGDVIGGTNSLYIQMSSVENTSMYSNSENIGGLAGDGSVREIKDCLVKNCVISSNAHSVGGILGLERSVTKNITGCHVVNCTIKGSYNVGGLVGYAASASGWSGNFVTNCAVNSTATSDWNTTYVCGNIPAMENTDNCSVTGHNFIRNTSASQTDTTIIPFPSYGWNTIQYITASDNSGSSVTVTSLGTYGTLGGYGVKSAPKYTVSYDGNGNTGGDAPSSAVYTVTAYAKVQGNTGGLVRTGYEFAGWNTEVDGSGTMYQQGDAFSVTEDTTLYARWATPYGITITTADNTYQLTDLLAKVNSDTGRGDGYAQITAADITTKTYTLTLHNFNASNMSGVPILNASVADLTINLVGESNLTGSFADNNKGLLYSSGNLTITNSGKLLVNNTISSSDYVTAIYSMKNLAIEDGANVIALAENEDNAGQANGIYAKSGDIKISNSANVTAIATAIATSGDAWSIYTLEKDITITNAKVTAKAHCNRDAYALYSCGGNLSISGTDTVVDANATSSISSGLAYPVIAAKNLTIESANKITSIGITASAQATSFVYSSAGSCDITALENGYIFKNATTGASLSFGDFNQWHIQSSMMLNNQTAVTIEKVNAPAPSYTSSSSKHSGSTVILQEGQTAPTAYATAMPTVAPTVAPTAAPTEQPATPTVIATEKPMTQATQQSPAPFVGILAGLGVAAVVLRLRK